MDSFECQCLQGFLEENWQAWVRYMDERFDNGEEAAEAVRAKLDEQGNP